MAILECLCSVFERADKRLESLYCIVSLRVVGCVLRDKLSSGTIPLTSTTGTFVPVHDLKAYVGVDL